MRQTTVTVPWAEGLHLLPACRLVQLARNFQSQIRMRTGSRVAEATSILSILLLCAALHAPIDIEVNGADEHDALRAVEEFFHQDMHR